MLNKLYTIVLLIGVSTKYSLIITNIGTTAIRDLCIDINTFIAYIRSFGATYVTAIKIKFDIFHLCESKQSLDFYIFLIVIPILTMTVKWYI